MNDSEASANLATGRVLTRPAIFAFAATGLAIAFALYWFVLRTNYVTVVSDVDPHDAADVAKLLENKKIAYHLINGGQAVQVPQEQADKARVELLGSDLSMRGQVGFELFNQSDMGLTEFDQKINYMRALQGELARTILLLDGIKQVRVHLGLAERSAFSADSLPAKASVTLFLKDGRTLTESRVRGIQRLVAGAVPDLAPDAVAVLDGTGRIVSADVEPTDIGEGPADPLTAEIQAHALDAVRAAYPDVHAQVEVALTYRSARDEDKAEGSPDAVMNRLLGATTATPKITVRIKIDRVLAPDAMHDLEASIIRAAGLHVDRGDAVLLSATTASTALPSPALPDRDRIVAQAAPSPAPETSTWWQQFWPFVAVIAIGALSLAWWTDSRRRQTKRRRELLQFSETLQARLAQNGSNPA